MDKHTPGGPETQLNRWPTYPAYKPSGLPWLGDIPAHWEVHKLKNKAKVTFSSVDKHTLEGEVSVRLVRVRKVFHRAKATAKDRCRLLSFITRTARLFVITPQPTQRSIPARP